MNKRSTPQVLTGLVIIALGIGFLLNALGFAPVGAMINAWWPLAIIAVGVAMLINNPRQLIWPLFVIAAGGLLELRALGIIDFPVWSTIWPLAIIAFGLSFIMHRGSVAPSTKASSDDHANVFVAFSGTKLQNNSDKFQGGQISAIFGGVEADLRGAHITDRAHLEITAAFGGVELRVPEDWTVIINGLPLFGGWEDKTTKPAKKGPVLEISGTALFGGIEIKN